MCLDSSNIRPAEWQEIARAKLMWALGQGCSQAQIPELFAQSLAGEITL